MPQRPIHSFEENAMMGKWFFAAAVACGLFAAGYYVRGDGTATAAREAPPGSAAGNLVRAAREPADSHRTRASITC